MKKKKKAFVTLRLSDFPWNTWIKIVLIKPSGAFPMLLPINTPTGMRRIPYLYFKAYFPSKGPDKIFSISFPRTEINRAIMTIKPELRMNINSPAELEFKKFKLNDNLEIAIRNYKEL